jgi:hypothetical protein
MSSLNKELLDSAIEKFNRLKHIPTIMVIGGPDYRYIPRDLYYEVGAHYTSNFGATDDKANFYKYEWNTESYWNTLDTFLKWTHLQFDIIFIDDGSQQYLELDILQYEQLALIMIESLSPNGVIILQNFTNNDVPRITTLHLISMCYKHLHRVGYFFIKKERQMNTPVKENQFFIFSKQPLLKDTVLSKHTDIIINPFPKEKFVKKIADELGIKDDRFYISMNMRLHVDYDHKSVTETCISDFIKNRTILISKPYEKTIYVMISGKLKTYHVREKDTIGDLKIKIMDREGLSQPRNSISNITNTVLYSDTDLIHTIHNTFFRYFGKKRRSRQKRKIML